MMDSFVGAAAALLLAASSVNGKYISAVRYGNWYGDFSRSNGFSSNPVAVLSADTGNRVGAFKPSEARVGLLDSLDFPLQTRDTETRIFSGIAYVPPCRAGIYRFRITSDDDTDMFLDNEHVLENPGRHKNGATTKTAVVHLRPNGNHQFQLWWGNYGGPSTLKVEICHSAAASLQAKKQGLLSSDDDSGVKLADIDLLDEVDDTSCVYTTDLSTIFKKQDLPTIQRCDYKGYWGDKVVPPEQMTPNTDNMPQACVEEAGGVIHFETVPNSETFAKSSYVFTLTIKTRAAGLHTFWLGSNDGSVLLVSGYEVVNNRGFHKTVHRSGSIHLEKDRVHTIQIYYGNAAGYGTLMVHWADPLTVEPQMSFEPLLVTRI